MKSWISSLAERLLGVSDFKTADVAAISQGLTPARELESPPAARPDDPEPIEILPEYEFVLELVKKQCPATFVTGENGIAAALDSASSFLPYPGFRADSPFR